MSNKGSLELETGMLKNKTSFAQATDKLEIDNIDKASERSSKKIMSDDPDFMSKETLETQDLACNWDKQPDGVDCFRELVELGPGETFGLKCFMDDHEY